MLTLPDSNQGIFTSCIIHYPSILCHDVWIWKRYASNHCHI